MLQNKYRLAVVTLLLCTALCSICYFSYAGDTLVPLELHNDSHAEATFYVFCEDGKAIPKTVAAHSTDSINRPKGIVTILCNVDHMASSLMTSNREVSTSDFSF